MDQIIEAFGIDLRLIVIQLVNFGILLGALSYFLYKPVMKMLDDRAARIATGLKDAEEAAAAKAAATDEKRAVVAAAHEEAGAITERARTHANELAEQAAGAAQVKAASIVSEAELRAAELKRQAEKESEAEIAKVAILAAEKILRERTAA